MESRQIVYWRAMFIGMLTAHVVFFLLILLTLYLLPWEQTLLPKAGDAIGNGVIPPMEKAINDSVDRQTENLKVVIQDLLTSTKETTISTFKETQEGVYDSAIDTTRTYISDLF